MRINISIESWKIINMKKTDKKVLKEQKTMKIIIEI